MAATIDFANLGTLSPEDYAEQQALSKRQRTAQALMNASMTAAPQGQMVSGHYVAPSFFEGLNKVAQAAAGRYVEDKADTEAMDYATRLRARDQEEMKTGLELWRGREGQAANPQAAADFFMTAKGKQAQALGAKLLEQQFKEPEWKETELKMPDGVVVQGQYNKNAPNPMATFVPFTSYGSVETAKAIDAGIKMPTIAGTGGTFRNGGMPQGGNFVNMAQGQGLPIISGQRDPAKQMSLVASQAPDGSFLTKEGRPVAVNSQHFHGNAVDLDPSKPISPAQQAWLNQYAVQGKGKDNNHYELKPEFRGQNMPAMPQSNAPQATDVKYKLLEPESGFLSEAEKRDWYKNARQPLTGEPLKEVTSGMGALKVLDRFETLANKWSKNKQLSPDEFAEMQAVSRDAMLSLKDVKKLGVLTGNDQQIVESVLRDPSNVSNILNSKDLFLKLARAQKASTRDAIIGQYQSNYKEVPAYIKNQLMDVDRQEATWAKSSNSKGESKEVTAMKQQSLNQPKAQDVTAIKSWLTTNKLPYEPEKYSYGIENGQYYREKRK